MTISGPYAATGPGETPSRDRLFVCRPKSTAEEAPCAREILSTLVRRAYRRPAEAADVDELWPFYEAGAPKGASSAGFSARSSVCS